MITSVSGYSNAFEIPRFMIRSEADAKKAGLTEGEIKGLKSSGQVECETCKNRKYQDGSDENVSFKSAAHIDPAAAGGAVLDMGVYAVYYLYKLFGKPEKIECKGDVHDGIDWSEEIWFDYGNGRRYKALASINDKGVTTNLKLTGTKASIYVPELHYASHAEFTDEKGEKIEFTGDGSYLNEFNRVSEEISEGLKESRYVTHEDTIFIMSVLDECRKQLNLKYDFE